MTDDQQSSTPPRARPWQKGFLAVLRESGNVRLACDAAQIDRSTAYLRRDADPSFAAAWDSALEEAADLLEAEAWRRAYDGWDEPVFGRVAKDQDGQIGIVRKYSDNLMQTLLKGTKPEKFRDRTDVRHSGKVDVGKLSDDELRALAES